MDRDMVSMAKGQRHIYNKRAVKGRERKAWNNMFLLCLVHVSAGACEQSMMRDG
jgi:hypothetical protein